MGWLSTLHADLHLGEPGRVYSELATSWLIVVLVGGVVLWWERSRRHRKPGREGTRTCWRRFLVVDRSHPGVHRTMSWHAVAGVWVVIIALALSLTGLMASVSAGSRWTGLLASLDASAPRLSTQVGPGAGAPTAPGGHAEHSAPTPAGADRPVTGRVPDGVSVDAVLAAARTAGVTESVNLTAPRAPGQGWSASETDLTLPVNLDQAVVDPASGRVVRTQAWADWPVLAQANRLLLFFHFNRTLGGVGQVLLIVTMIAVTASVLWGYQMWWQRRPQHGDGFRLGRAPRRGAWRAAPRGRLTAAVVATAIVGVILPVFGVSLLGFLLLDAVIGYVRRHHRDAQTPVDADLHGHPAG